MANFLMPKLGADMTGGTLNAWLKKPGDAIQRGDIVAEVETEKGVIDVEAFVTGVLEKVLVQPGEKVPVGTVLALIQERAGAVTAAIEPKTTNGAIKALATPAVPQASLPQAPAAASTPGGERLHVSPAARTKARELGVELASVHGTGPRGVITREDVERAAAARVAGLKPEPTPADRAARLRQTIAAAMSRSKREVPHYYLSTTIDLKPALSWLAEYNEKHAVEERLIPGVLFLKAVALALREVPELNATWDGDRVITNPSIHVGTAIALRHGGLIAPAIHDTDRLSLDELMRKFRDLVMRARAGSLRSSELSDPTITVTSLGDQGVEAVFGIIYPPQVAIVGFGKVSERPWVVDGHVVPRPLATATLSADHRVSDGHRGSLFLAAIERLLQEPEKL